MPSVRSRRWLLWAVGLAAWSPGCSFDGGGKGAPDAALDAAQPSDDATIGDAGPIDAPDAAAPPCLSAPSAGSEHTCFATPNGRAYCTGKDDKHQLSTTESSFDRSALARVLALPPGIAEVSAGLSHTCARTMTGAAYCWGDDVSGQLGAGAVGAPRGPTPVALPGETTVAEISAGNAFTCARTGTGRVMCWGHNLYGQLGIGAPDALPHPVPTEIPGLTGVVEISAGDFHACARTIDGAAYCWGLDNYGQLGGDVAPVTAGVPVRVGVAAGELVRGIEAGYAHSCAIVGGEVHCWGLNNLSQLGLGSADLVRHARPTRVSGLTPQGWDQVSVGVGHSCARHRDGSVLCWGYNHVGQLGLGDRLSVPMPAVATRLPVGARADAIDLGYYHACARLTDGRVFCWGWNGAGQLGAASSTAAFELPVEVLFNCD